MEVAYRIAVVEDERMEGLVLQMNLESFGYAVTGIYASGEEALDAMESEPPDLAIMDIRLNGELDGVETALQAKRRFDIPVILLTAMADESTLERAKETQPFGYIIKPFEQRELRTAIEIGVYRHRMEHQLRERQLLFSTTLESIRDGVIVTDDNYHVEFVNSIAQAMIGEPEEELLGSDLRATCTCTDEEGASTDLNAPSGSPVFLVRKDGTRLPVDKYVAPLGGRESGLTGWVVVLHDVTERLDNERRLREQEEQLRQSQKMEAMGRLTGGIAHDFNNLLTVIMGYSKLLSEELLGLDSTETSSLLADVDGIHKAATRSATLTRQLLAFSRRQIMERRVVSLNQIIGDMEKLIERLVSDDVSAHVDLRAARAVVHADPGQIEQVVMNLVVNARDAMPGGGSITIRTENRSFGPEEASHHDGAEPGEYVSLSVKDTGSGMTPETMEKIFEPFFTTKEHGRGTGLGLSTVYGIVAQSGGFVDVQSRLGSGSTFTIYLRVHGGSEDDGSAEIVDEPERGDESILLVEDEAAIRQLLTRVLQKYGYKVTAAAGPGDALDVWDRHGESFDMIIADVVMPDQPGTTLAKQLRESTPGLKVLLISAFPESYLNEKDRKELGIHFMEKPLDPKAFVRRVRHILDE
jgi:two-component system cell cycle sensor histidine kinase/response regulator CckA